eukprot:15410827-Alexandrium_andersonii.AAC.1
MAAVAMSGAVWPPSNAAPLTCSAATRMHSALFWIIQASLLLLVGADWPLGSTGLTGATSLRRGWSVSFDRFTQHLGCSPPGRP